MPLLPLLFWACETQVDQKSEGPAPSLILLTLDTTRADHLGCYGRKAAGTPTLDRLANEGLLFERAYSTTPLTTPSHASMLTGFYPPKHGVRSNGDAIVPEEITTLAEYLNGENYQTMASVSAFVTTAVWNLDQGFDVYSDEIPVALNKQRWGQERKADAVANDIIQWLNQDASVEKPAFIWAHFYDPHYPHEPPDELKPKYPTLYDAEIAFMDQQIDRILSAAEAKYGADNIAVIAIADHGEAFNGEHSEESHGLFLFEPTMRIPFIVRPPKALKSPMREKDLAVSGVDVLPTALGVLGFQAPTDIDGVDLSPIIDGIELTRKPTYMEALMVKQRFGYHPEISGVEGAFKLMDTPSPRLFNVDEDPGEMTNLIGQHEEIVGRIRPFLQGVWNAQGIKEDISVTPDMLQQLSALGYMSTGMDGQETQIDAKDNTETIQQIAALRTAVQQKKDIGPIIKAYETLLENQSQLGEARMTLANLYGKVGDHEKAILIYKEALELEPNSTIIRSNLANSLAAQDRFDEGIALLEEVIKQVPSDAIAQKGILRMLIDNKQSKSAIERGSEWLNEDPESRVLQAHVGIALLHEKQYKLSEELLKASLQDDIPREHVQRGLYELALLRNEPEVALEHLQLELDHFPEPQAQMLLAELNFRLKKWDEASKAYLTYLDQFPPRPKIRYFAAQSLFNIQNYEKAREILDPALKLKPQIADVLLLHANLLAKEGKREEGLLVFQQAKALKEAEVNRVAPTE